MESTVPVIDRKPQATAAKRSQVEMPFIAEVATLLMLDIKEITRVTFNGCLVRSAQHSGKEDQEIADEIHISHGYMSRFMRGVAQQWAKRLVAFMRVTQSLAPLQWMAEQMGCEVTRRDSQALRIAQLQAELAEHLSGRRSA